MPTTHRLSFPTCLSHPRSIHLHCHTVHRLLHLPCLGLQQQAGPEFSELCSKSYVGPLSPGEKLTSSTHSLTWREFLTGLTTCLFNHNHLPHLERVLHTGLTTCFFNLFLHKEDNNKTQQGTNDGDNHTQPRDCMAATTHSYNTHDIDIYGMLRLHRRCGSASRV
jgi:hypothetical protein